MSDKDFPPKPVEFVWSLDGESYMSGNVTPSIGEALAAAKALNDGPQGDPLNNYCSVGIVRRYAASEFYPQPSHLFECMRGEAYNCDAGEWAANSNWLADVAPDHYMELRREIHAVLDNFFAVHPEYQPGDKFFSVDDTEDYELDPDGE